MLHKNAAQNLKEQNISWKTGTCWAPSKTLSQNVTVMIYGIVSR